MLMPEELKAVDDFRFKQRMPSRAAAVRELIRLGLTSTNSVTKMGPDRKKSADFGMLGQTNEHDGDAR